MATTTTNLKLVKPDLTDFADIRVLNQNMDTLDEKVQQALDKEPDLSAYMPITGGNFTGNIKVQNNQVMYATNALTDENNNYYIEYSDGSIVCGGTFTDLNIQRAIASGGTTDVNTYAKRVNYLQPISKTMIGFTATILPDDASSFWGNSSATVMLRKRDNTGFYMESRCVEGAMLKDTASVMWRAYFK